MPERLELEVRLHGDRSRAVLVYLPGLHGDWTLVHSFRAALGGRVCFVELTYPRTLEWSLDQYAEAIDAALGSRGIRRGWLLGESFGSQLVWPLIARRARLGRQAFEPAGVILAGGFVRHPIPWGVRGAARFLSMAPWNSIQRGVRLYRWYARFRHRRAPETLAGIDEFVARRTQADLQAAVHRLWLIALADPRPTARSAAVPIWYLAGLVDPLVPWPWVRNWLRRESPAYRGGKTFWCADHNVLATAPAAAARQVLVWMAAGDSCLQRGHAQ